MKVIERLRRSEGLIFSVEIQPPRIGNSKSDITTMLDPLVELGISWVDITYHAANIVDYIETRNHRFPLYQRLHPGTSGIAGAITERYAKQGVIAVPHVICTGFTQYDTEDFLHELVCLGITDVLAIRGDGPKDKQGNILPFEPVPGGHSFAYQLIQQISGLRSGQYLGAAIGDRLDFGIGAACYPEGRPEEASIEKEYLYMKIKADAGAEYFMTQLFYDTDAYIRFVEDIDKHGISQPIIPGLKPLTTYRHLEVLPRIFGCKIPKALQDRVERHKDSKDDIKKIGIEWCIEQSIRLHEYGAPSLHYYMMRDAPVKEVIAAVQEACSQKELVRVKRSKP